MQVGASRSVHEQHVTNTGQRFDRRFDHMAGHGSDLTTVGQHDGRCAGRQCFVQRRPIELALRPRDLRPPDTLLALYAEDDVETAAVPVEVEHRHSSDAAASGAGQPGDHCRGPGATAASDDHDRFRSAQSSSAARPNRDGERDVGC